MNGQLTNAQGELLIYIPIVEESIRKGEIDMDFDEAIDALIEGSSLFDFDTLHELKNMDYIDDETQLTQKGKVFVEEQLEKEDKENAENARQQKKQRIETVVTVASSVIGSVAGEVAKKIIGGGQ